MAILNSRINRRSSSWFAMLLIAILGLGLTLPLAALSTSTRVQTEIHKPVSATPDSALLPSQSARPQIPAAQQTSREISKPDRAVVASVAQPIKPQNATPTAPTPPQQQTQYRGEIVSFDVRSLTLREFFKLIGTTSGLNISTDPSINDLEPFNLRLTDVPWDQALDIVMKQNHLIGELKGNVLRIQQAPTPVAEAFTMTFEIYRNGSLIGAPRITTTEKQQATVAQGKGTTDGNVPGPDDLKISATPSRSADDRISLNLEIFVGAGGTRNNLVVSSGEQRSISWRSSSGDSLEARITTSVKK